jgi:hypothetical protein
MKRRRSSVIQEIERRALDLDPRSIDALYGLEPVYEPGADAAALGAFIELQCPWCGEVYGTMVDLTDRSRVYIEDCQVCCAPIEVTLEVSDGGELLNAATARVE